MHCLFIAWFDRSATFCRQIVCSVFPCVHCFPTLSTMTSWTSGCLFNYPAASLHDDLCYFLILVVVCDQSLMLQCSISALGWWLFTFPYPYPLGKPLLYIADHRDIFTERSNLVSYLLFNKQHYQRCHKDFTRALWLWNPQTLRSASFPFSPLLMMSQGGFPFSPHSSVMVAKFHRCTQESPSV